jgi:hypothetical protein
MYMFLAIMIQIGHNVRGALKDYWLAQEEFYTPFYSNTMKCYRFFHI